MCSVWTDLLKNRKFIKYHYKEMYLLWQQHDGGEFYRGN